MPTVPLVLRREAGLRPFVTAEVDDRPVELMVHSNASFGAMLTHTAAARVGLEVGPVEQPGYGIARVGALSGSGRASATASTLRVGDDVVHGRRIEVFDVPVDPDEEPSDGMLGLGWLRDRQVVVDLARSTLTTRAAAITGTALERHPAWEAWVVRASVGGVAGRWIVSTVAGVMVDEAAVERLGLRRGSPAGDDGGPTGTVVTTHRVEGSWSVEVDGRSFAATSAVTTDHYAYAGKERPPGDDLAGTLGLEFLLAHGARFDVGRGVLALAHE